MQVQTLNKYFICAYSSVDKGPTSFNDLYCEWCPTQHFHGGMYSEDFLKLAENGSNVSKRHLLRKQAINCVNFTVLASLSVTQHNLLVLWEQFVEYIYDDLAHRLSTMFYIPEPTTKQIRDYGLFLLDKMLFQ